MRNSTAPIPVEEFCELLVELFRPWEFDALLAQIDIRREHLVENGPFLKVVRETVLCLHQRGKTGLFLSHVLMERPDVDDLIRFAGNYLPAPRKKFPQTLDPLKRLANRQAIHGHYQALLASETQRALLIRGEEFVGKTLLMSALVECSRVADLPVCHVSLNDRGQLQQLCDYISTDLQSMFGLYGASAAPPCDPFSLSNQLRIVADPFVLFIDAFENGTREVKDWIKKLIGASEFANNLRMVIAGRQTPEVSTPRWTRIEELKAIPDPDEWVAYAEQNSEVAFKQDQHANDLRMVVKNVKGHPLAIDVYIRQACPRELNGVSL